MKLCLNTDHYKLFANPNKCSLLLHKGGLALIKTRKKRAFALLLCGIAQGVGLDLLHHREQTVGTGGRKVVF